MDKLMVDGIGGWRQSSQLAMQIFLKARDLNIEAEDFRGDCVLGSKFLGSLDAPLPGRDGHRAIISSVNAAMEGLAVKSHRGRLEPPLFFSK